MPRHFDYSDRPDNDELGRTPDSPELLRARRVVRYLLATRALTARDGDSDRADRTAPDAENRR